MPLSKVDQRNGLEVNVFKSPFGIFDSIVRFTAIVGVILIILLSAFVTLHSIFRAGFSINVSGLFDYSMYALLIFPFISMAYVLKRDKHISVDMLSSALPERARNGLILGIYLVGTLFPVVLTWQLIVWAVNSFATNTMTQTLIRVPLGIFVSILVFGSALLVIQMIQSLVLQVRTTVNYESSAIKSEIGLPGLIRNPWLVAFLFVVCVGLSVMVFVYLNPIVGLALLALALLFGGMPVFLALGFIGSIGVLLLWGSPMLIQIPLVSYRALFSFPLTCLPLFILGGTILEKGGTADELFRCFELWAGRYKGAALFATIALGLMFCAISGSSVATTAIVAAVALPILASRGYKRSLSCGIVGGSTIGTIIPPSIGLVVYAVMTNESISQLFMAIIIPGIIIFGMMFLYVGLLSLRKKSIFENGIILENYAVEQATWKEKFIALKDAIWGVLIPVIILGGIYLAIFTPTEAAGILVLYATVLCFVRRRITFKGFYHACLRSTETSTMVLCIIFAAYSFALVVSQLQIAASLVEWISSTGMGTLGVLLIVAITLLILGLFLDASACKVITLPVLFPVAMHVGINPLFLGVFYQILQEIGLLTPPVGLNLFVMKGATGYPMKTIITGVTPFIIIMIISLAIMYIFPQTVTWLPSTMLN